MAAHAAATPFPARSLCGAGSESLSLQAIRLGPGIARDLSSPDGIRSGHLLRRAAIPRRSGSAASDEEPGAPDAPRTVLQRAHPGGLGSALRPVVYRWRRASAAREVVSRATRAALHRIGRRYAAQARRRHAALGTGALGGGPQLLARRPAEARFDPFLDVGIRREIHLHKVRERKDRRKVEICDRELWSEQELAAAQVIVQDSQPRHERRACFLDAIR